MILVIGLAVAGAFSLAVNKTSIAANLGGSGQATAVTSPGSQSTAQVMSRSEGGELESGSLNRGLGGLLGTLTKLTGITILVLLIQRLSGWLGNRRSFSTG
jgi:hypothetical protein